MTLVVAQADRDIAYFVADTLLTRDLRIADLAPGPINGQEHALKIHILNPVTTVAFAGDTDAALGLVVSLHARLSENPSLDPFQTMLAMYRDASMPDCDFLLTQLNKGNNRLAKITRDGITSCQRGYIGIRKLIGIL